MLKSLITAEHIRILFDTVAGDGSVEMVDPQIAIGATDKDIIKAADGYDVTRIIRFDTRSLRGVDISEQVSRSYEETFDHNSPIWIKSLPSFGAIAAEDMTQLRQSLAHQRSFSHQSNYL